MTQPIWLRTTQNAVEIAVAIALLALAGLLVYESLRLGPGWGEQGPHAGFFPFILTMMAIIGTLGVLVMAVRSPRTAPFFEVNQEVVDLLKVGLPILATIFAMRWLGLFISAGLYIGLFMAWYGRFRWYSALAGAIVLPFALWLTLIKGFNISMPMSMFYRGGTLPI